MTVAQRIAFQLYSARALPADEKVLVMLATAGYGHIETFEPWHDNPHRTRRLASEQGFSIPSAHIALVRLRDEPARVMEVMQALGAKLVVVPYLAEQERPSSAEGWRELGHELEAHAERLNSHGLRLAWHNHDFEFMELGDRTMPMSLLIEAAPSLYWEMDVGWTGRAGQDPLGWIARHGRRIAALHVKDIARPGSEQVAEGWCGVGSGSIDWPAIVQAARSQLIGDFVIEHDNPPNPAIFAATSLHYFKPLLGS